MIGVVTSSDGVLRYQVLTETRIAFATNGITIARSLDDLKYLRNLAAMYGPRNEAGNEVTREQFDELIDALVQRIRSNRKAVGA